MVVRVQYCSSLAWAALLGVLGSSASVQAQTVAVQPSPIHQVQDGASEPPAPLLAPNNRPPAPPATPVTAGPRVAVARRIVDAAGAFDGYMRRASAIKADFSSGDAVAHAVLLGSTYQAEQLEEGAIAYVALVALQDRGFVAAVSDVAQNRGARDQFAARILEHPEAVLGAPAARRAVTRVSSVLGQMGLQLVAAGAAVKQASYDSQSQEWSKGLISEPEKRLAWIKAQSAAPISLVPADTAYLFTGLQALRETGENAEEAGAATPVAVRGLAVAALAILGHAGDDQVQTVTPLLTEEKEAECIKMARLNLHQCLAVAGPNYEDVFCLGRHAMMETGQCIAAAAGVNEDEIRPVMDTTSVLVPVAMAPASGPEREADLAGPSPVAKADNVGVPVAAMAPVVARNYSPYSGPTDP